MPNPNPMEGEPTLVEQAGSLPRALVMRDIMGPALTRLLAPVYDEQISEEEKLQLDEKMLNSNFTKCLEEILCDRIEKVSEDSPSERQQIDELCSERPDLVFYHNEPRYVLKEGVSTGVIIPLIIATHIHGLEDQTTGDDISVLEAPDQSQAALDIMERSSFDRILISLTKGPNGFLGGPPFHGKVWWRGFFDFQGLDMAEAYSMENGRVQGLSYKYHQAAARERAIMNHGRSQQEARDNSSGCPFRHRYPDATGAQGESLIMSGKRFLMAAIRTTLDEAQATT